ncbi:MAG TPA: hypothetical protein VEW03_03115 [Longimicrobiaceae bacterium]|nr:hypothetical protein [Longimicrobiaceae bacterium]
MRRLLSTVLAAFVLAPSIAAGQGGTEVRLDPQEWRRLNVFFSNFAEASIEPFAPGEVPATTLIQFGVLHNLINAFHRVQAVPGRPDQRRLSASQIGSTIMKYFGVPFTRHQSLDGDYAWIEYAGGYYVFPLTGGETYPFVQVDRLGDVGNGELIASLSTYRIPEEDDADRYGIPVEQLRRTGHEVELQGRMRARIRRVRENGEERYVLLGYALVFDLPTGAPVTSPIPAASTGSRPAPANPS